MYAIRSYYAEQGRDVLRVEAKRLDHEIRKGETMVIIGSSGTGKSTLLRCIIGLTEPDQGRVFVGGKDVHAMTGP